MRAKSQIMSTFERILRLPVSAEEGFIWHERPGALDRLIPPWERVQILKRGKGVHDGSVVELAQKLGPLRIKWIAQHHGYRAGEAFQDTQVAGPFTKWEHLHKFDTNGSGQSILTDRIEYREPGGILGRWIGGGLIKKKLDAMFAYRHRTTREDLAAHAKHQEVGTMHIAVTGASGLVGSTLVPLLTTGGHQVTRLVRGEAGAGGGQLGRLRDVRYVLPGWHRWPRASGRREYRGRSLVGAG